MAFLSWFLILLLNLIVVLGDKFIKYIEAFKPYLAAALKNFEEHQVGTQSLRT